MGPQGGRWEVGSSGGRPSVPPPRASWCAPLPLGSLPAPPGCPAPRADCPRPVPAPLTLDPHPVPPRPPRPRAGPLEDGERARLWAELVRTASADLGVDGELPPLPAFPAEVRAGALGDGGGGGPPGGSPLSTPFRRSPGRTPSAPRPPRPSPWDPRPSPGRPSPPPRGEEGAPAAPTGCSAGPAGAWGPPPRRCRDAPRQSPARCPRSRGGRRGTGRRRCRAAPCARSTSHPGECPALGVPLRCHLGPAVFRQRGARAGL